MSRYKEILSDLEASLDELESKGVVVKPLAYALNELRRHSDNIQTVENDVDAIREEILSPVQRELIENKRAGTFSIFGFYVGSIGLVASLLSLIYATYSSNQTRLAVQDTQASIADNLQDLTTVKKGTDNLKDGIVSLKRDLSKLSDQIQIVSVELRSGDISGETFIKTLSATEARVASLAHKLDSLLKSMSDNAASEYLTLYLVLTKDDLISLEEGLFRVRIPTSREMDRFRFGRAQVTDLIPLSGSDPAFLDGSSASARLANNEITLSLFIPRSRFDDFAKFFESDDGRLRAIVQLTSN